jgi:hypothetical protein
LKAAYAARSSDAKCVVSDFAVAAAGDGLIIGLLTAGSALEKNQRLIFDLASHEAKT